MRKNKTYKPSRQQMKHVDAVLKLLSVFGEDERFTMVNSDNGTKGVRNMCEWLDEVEEKSRQQGMEQGMEQTSRRIVINMINRNMPDEDICAVAECKKEFVDKMRKEIAKEYEAKYGNESV